MRFSNLIRTALLLLALTALPGCAALRSATTSLDTYELTPLPQSSSPARRGGRHLLVELPTATAAIASDKIVIKPNPLQVQSLPGVRWVDVATDHVRLLLVRSLANTGRFGLVTGPEPGPLPDIVLLTDLDAFQAETSTGEDKSVKVLIGMTLTLVRDTGTVIATRRFDRVTTAVSGSNVDILNAFNLTMTGLLGEAVPWVVSQAR